MSKILVTKDGPNDKFIYFNCELTNNTDSNINAVFEQNFVSPIFEDATEYKFACARFSINTQNIPISIMEVADPSTSATTLPYSVTLDHNGDVVTVPLQWITQSNKPTPPLSATQNLNNDFYYLWNFQHFIDIVNTGLATAFAGLSAPPGGSEAPFIEIIDGTSKLRLVSQIAFYDTNNTAAANLIKVYFNRRLLSLLEHFKGIRNDGNDTLAFQFLITNEGSNNDEGTITRPTAAPGGTETYYYMDQYKPSLALFESFSRIIIISEDPFFRSEFYPPSIQPFGVPREPANRISAQAGKSIMTDYVIPSDSLLESTSDTVIYVPESYRFADVIKKDIPRLSFRILWVDQYNNTYDLTMAPGTICTFKFVFVGRDAI